MPCGIYRDDMVFDMIDQYVETMHKAMHELDHINTKTVEGKNQFIRWILTKEKESDSAANLITTYFLQQKISPAGIDTERQVLAAHKLLFQLVAIKQSTKIDIVDEFSKQWEAFKLMFHIEGYECEKEKIKLKEWDEKRNASENSPTNSYQPRTYPTNNGR